MKIVEFHVRKKKNHENHRNPVENHDNHEKLRNSYDNHANHENLKVPLEIQ